MDTPGDDASAPDAEESRVEVYVTTDTSALCGAAHPDGDKLYFTEAEWEAFVRGVQDGEFDLDESGNLP